MYSCNLNLLVIRLHFWLGFFPFFCVVCNHSMIMVFEDGPQLVYQWKLIMALCDMVETLASNHRPGSSCMSNKSHPSLGTQPPPKHSNSTILEQLFHWPTAPQLCLSHYFLQAPPLTHLTPVKEKQSWLSSKSLSLTIQTHLSKPTAKNRDKSIDTNIN